MSQVKRLISLDVMRGITIAFMILVNTPGSWSYVYAPLLHAKWHGCTPTDLVFPFFLFMVGLSAAFSLKKYNYRPNSAALTKIFRRTLLIFFIGLTLNYFPFFNKTLSELRIMGVLQRIALGYGLGALIIVLTKRKYIPIVGLAILLLYWILLYIGNPSAPYSLEGNINTVVDKLLLGEKHLYGGFGIPFDPEGLLGTFPAAVNVLFGYMVGRFVLEKPSANQLMKYLLILGVSAVVIALVWNPFFPINKPLWTSSYVLLSCGIASLLLALLYWLIDIKGWSRWSYPFKVYGSNALFAYVLSVIFVKIMLTWKVVGGSVYGNLFKNIFQPIFGDYFGSFMFAISINVIVWLCVLILYRKRIYIKL